MSVIEQLLGDFIVFFLGFIIDIVSSVWCRRPFIALFLISKLQKSGKRSYPLYHFSAYAPAVSHWRFLFSISLSVKFVVSLSTALERDGRKGSLAKFDRSVGFVGFANVP